MSDRGVPTIGGRPFQFEAYQTESEEEKMYYSTPPLPSFVPPPPSSLSQSRYTTPVRPLDEESEDESEDYLSMQKKDLGLKRRRKGLAKQSVIRTEEKRRSRSVSRTPKPEPVEIKKEPVRTPDHKVYEEILRNEPPTEQEMRNADAFVKQYRNYVEEFQTSNVYNFLVVVAANTSTKSVYDLIENWFGLEKKINVMRRATRSVLDIALAIRAVLNKYKIEVPTLSSSSTSTATPEVSLSAVPPPALPPLIPSRVQTIMDAFAEELREFARPLLKSVMGSIREAESNGLHVTGIPEFVPALEGAILGVINDLQVHSLHLRTCRFEQFMVDQKVRVLFARLVACQMNFTQMNLSLKTQVYKAKVAQNEYMLYLRKFRSVRTDFAGRLHYYEGDEFVVGDPGVLVSDDVYAANA